MVSDEILLVLPMGQGFIGHLFRGAACVASREAERHEDLPEILGAHDHSLILLEQKQAETVPCPLSVNDLDQFRPLAQSNPRDEASVGVRLAAIGYVAMQTNWDGVLVIIDEARSHWLHISANEVISLQTTLTPQLITSLNGANEADQEVLSITLSRPERLAVALSQADIAGEGAAITGALIGAELAGARPYWLGQSVAVIAENDRLSNAYTSGLIAQGVPVDTLPLSRALWRGLEALTV